MPALRMQRGIGGESLNPGIVREFQDGSAVGAVGEDLDTE